MAESGASALWREQAFGLHGNSSAIHACWRMLARTVAQALLNVVFLEFAVQGGCPNG
jgi:hypothetical protein